MEIQEDDDTLFLESAIPDNPTIDPLDTTDKGDDSDYNYSYLCSDEIINVDSSSSDEERSLETQQPINNDLVRNEAFNTPILQHNIKDHVLNKKSLKPYTVDIDADDLDPLAPLRCVIKEAATNRSVLKTYSSQSLKGMSKVITEIPNKARYLSKINQTMKFSKNSIEMSTAKRHKVKTGSSKRTKIMKIQQGNTGNSKKPIGTPQKTSPSINNSSLLSTNSTTEETKMVDCDASDVIRTDLEMDLPVQKFILCKPSSSNKKEPYANSSIDPVSPNVFINNSESCGNNYLPAFSINNLNSTGFDFNVNICNASTSVTTSLKSTSAMKSKKIVRNQQTNPGYNVELGLVLNVNEGNCQPLSSHQRQMGGLNNVALDVSVNMNNNGKQSPGLSTQVLQDCDSEEASTPCQTEKSFNSNSRNYFMSTDSSAMKSRNCKLKAPEKISICHSQIYNTHSVQKRYLVTQNKEDRKFQKEISYQCTICFIKSKSLNVFEEQDCLNQIKPRGSGRYIIKNTSIYICSLCPFKTTWFSLFKEHSCGLKLLDANQHASKETSTFNQPDRIYCCSICSYKSTYRNHVQFHRCAMSSLSLQPTTTQDSKLSDELPVLSPLNPNQIYCCAGCLWKTDDLTVMNTHICSLTEDNQMIPQPEGIFCCVKCSYKTADVNGMNCHVCPSENKQSPQVYMCSECSYQTTDIGVINSHACLQNPLSELQQVQSNIFRCTTCLYSTNDMNSISSHLCPKNNAKLLTNVRQNSSQTYSCAQCSYQTTIKEDMGAHTCPLSQTNAPENTSKAEHIKAIQHYIKRIFTCAKCSYKFSDKEKIKQHKCFSSKPDSDLFQCVHCLYTAKQLNFIKTHQCPKNSKGAPEDPIIVPCPVKTHTVSTIKSQSSLVEKPAKFSCLACSFTTAHVTLANAHKCRSKKVEKKALERYCQICKYNCADSFDLFAHVMNTHFSITKIWTCSRCNDSDNFDCSEDLIVHQTMQHPDSDPSFKYDDKEGIKYKCTFCRHVMQSTSVENHVGDHIRYHRMTEATMFQDHFQYFFMRSQGTPVRQYPPALNNRLKTIHGDKEGVKCYYCKLNIYTAGLKCVNSDCNNWYHIHCCNNYCRRKLTAPIPDISDRPDWFCLECNPQEILDVFTLTENVKTYDYCLNVVDKLIEKEVDVQNSMLKEVQKINAEKLATKEEFSRIKTFIINSKSERINNPMVKGVCNIIEKFINADVDDKAI